MNLEIESKRSLQRILDSLNMDHLKKHDQRVFKERVEQLCAGYENADEMVQTYLSNPQIMQQVEPMVLEDQAIDGIIANGKEKSKKIRFKEYMKPQG